MCKIVPSSGYILDCVFNTDTQACQKHGICPTTPNLNRSPVTTVVFTDIIKNKAKTKTDVLDVVKNLLNNLFVSKAS